jgi:hypothetical protein
MLFPLLGFLAVAGVSVFFAWDRHVMYVATIEGALRRHHARDIRVSIGWFDTDWEHGIHSYDVAYVDASGRRWANRCRIGAGPGGGPEVPYWRERLEG